METSHPVTGGDARQQEDAVDAVCRADRAMAAFIRRAGPYDVRPGTGDHFAALVRSVCYQQLAGSAAAAIHARLVAAIGGRVTAEAVRAADPALMRGAGLSSAKLASILDLAAKVTDGSVPLGGIESLDDDAVISRLITVRGIGTWTAQMFLMFELRRPDVWPVGDLGVRLGWKLIHELEAMPAPRVLDSAGEPFRPYRSCVAWYCWHAVHVSRFGPGLRS